MFNKQNFCHVASNNRNEQKAGIFVYKTTDSLATITASGYFNEKLVDINLHDLIIHEQTDNADKTKVTYNILAVTERTLDNVGTKVIKRDWDTDIETAIETLRKYVDNTFVKLDGTSTMTGPLKMRATSSFQCAIAPFWDGVGFYKLNSDDSVTLIASIETPDGFVPWVTNTYNIGSSLKKWKNLYLSGTAYIAKINNGYDIAVPVTNSADTLALKSEVDLAANSGRMILDQGVWYAKMYAATVAPAAENGTNYADFSQTDGQGNPIIVTYNRVNGAWVQDQTITPPAEYDGYVSITSKIWDITEQAGQQGGRILWNHQSKEFTPYPQIISFENAALTGTPTASTPTSSSPNNQIATKGYVDSFSGANTSLSNLTATGKANISSKGTYDSSATYSAGTVGAAISGKADTDFNNTNMIDYVVSFQRPTASNNYTWYRKYKSGWVEQGGVTNYSTGGQTVDLPVIMADTNYSVSVTIFSNSGFSTTGGNTPAHACTAVSTTQIRVNQENASSKKSYWQVSGMSAS